jgi:hypothetical protein
MAASLKKLLIGTSVAVGISAIASLPAKAASFDFDNSETNYATYTHQDGNLWIQGNEAAAISALTDNNIQTNVELNYEGEDDNDSVGFTVSSGKYTAKVSSVTDAEFLTFQDQWVNDLMDAYAPLKTVWNTLSNPLKTAAKAMFTDIVGSGDVNVGSFSLDQTGAMSMETLGFLNLTPRVTSLIDDTVKKNPILGLLYGKQIADLKGALTQIGQLQISELAKVELNGVSEYVYSFNATDSGFVAKDDVAGKSYSGVYSWNKAGTPVAVPEPSTILGLMAIGGLFGAAKHNANKKA